MYTHAVYSYLTRYPYGDDRSGRLFRELHSIDVWMRGDVWICLLSPCILWTNPDNSASTLQTGPPFQDLTSGSGYSPSQIDSFLVLTLSDVNTTLFYNIIHDLSIPCKTLHPLAIDQLWNCTSTWEGTQNAHVIVLAWETAHMTKGLNPNTCLLGPSQSGAFYGFTMFFFSYSLSPKKVWCSTSPCQINKNTEINSRGLALWQGVIMELVPLSCLDRVKSKSYIHK